MLVKAFTFTRSEKIRGPHAAWIRGLVGTGNVPDGVGVSMKRRTA
jgi:hypothetical protein